MPMILVVEDEQVIAEMLEELLEQEGFEVVTAGNGSQGLACLAEALPQVVLSDVMMPGMDGRAFCRALQADPTYRLIPVILMSAAVVPDTDDGCPYAAFVRKPFDVDTLVATITAVLNRAQADERGVR